MGASEAGKGSDPRPVQDRAAFDRNMRAIYGTRVRIPGGHDRDLMVEFIVTAILEHYGEMGMVVPDTYIRTSVEKTLGFLEGTAG